MAKVLKTIRFELTEKSIDEAIREVEKFAESVQKAAEETARDMTTLGEIYARTELADHPGFIIGPNPADYADGIKSQYSEDEHEGHIFTDDPEAVFVEYGVGIIGENFPHPGIQSGESTPPIVTMDTKDGVHMYTKYDTYEHGDKGWYYNDGNEMVHTIGYAGTAFMYNTMRRLEEEAPEFMMSNLREKGDG